MLLPITIWSLLPTLTLFVVFPRTTARGREVGLVPKSFPISNVVLVLVVLFTRIVFEPVTPATVVPFKYKSTVLPPVLLLVIPYVLTSGLAASTISKAPDNMLYSGCSWWRYRWVPDSKICAGKRSRQYRQIGVRRGGIASGRRGWAGPIAFAWSGVNGSDEVTVHSRPGFGDGICRTWRKERRGNRNRGENDQSTLP